MSIQPLAVAVFGSALFVIILAPSSPTTLQPNLKKITDKNKKKDSPVLRQDQRQLVHEKSRKNSNNGNLADFKSLVETNKFIDKTGLIKWYLELEKHTIVTAPRQFGKTTSLDMLRRYYQIQTDQNGTRIPLTESENYKLFSSAYFSNKTKLAINEASFPFFGSLPVLTLDFAGLKTTTRREFTKSFFLMIQNSCREFEYLKDSKKISKSERDNFLAYMYGSGEKEYDALYAVYFLEHILYYLYQHFDRKPCIVLIDNMDAPIKRMLDFEVDLEQNRIIGDLQYMIQIIFVGTRCPYVAKGYFLGETELSRIYLYDTIDLDYKSFHSDRKAASFYGANFAEVDFFRQQFPSAETISMKTVQEFYDGYQMKDETSKVLKYYSIFSVKRYFETNKLKSWWAASRLPPYMPDLLKITNIMNLVRDSILGFNIIVDYNRIYNSIGFEEVKKLRKIIADLQEPRAGIHVFPPDPEIIMPYFLEFGYYTPVKIDRNQFTVVIPNKEIHQYLSELFIGWLEDYFDISSDTMNNYKKSLISLSNNLECMQNFVNRTADLFANARRLPGNSNEFLNLFLVFLKKQTSDTKIEYPRTEAEQSRRSNVIMLRHNLKTKKRSVIIIQAAYRDNSFSALKQLTDSKFNIYQNNTIDEFILVGLNFNQTTISGSFLNRGSVLESAANLSCPIDSRKRMKNAVMDCWEDWKNFSKKAFKKFKKKLPERMASMLSPDF